MKENGIESQYSIERKKKQKYNRRNIFQRNYYPDLINRDWEKATGHNPAGIILHSDRGTKYNNNYQTIDDYVKGVKQWNKWYNDKIDYQNKV